MRELLQSPRLRATLQGLDAAATRKVAGVGSEAPLDIALPELVRVLGTKLAYDQLKQRRIRGGLESLSELEKNAGLKDRVVGGVKRLFSRGSSPAVEGAISHTPASIPNVARTGKATLPTGPMQTHTVSPNAAGRKEVLVSHGGSPAVVEGNTAAIEMGATPIPDYVHQSKPLEASANPAYIGEAQYAGPTHGPQQPTARKKNLTTTEDVSHELPMLHQIQDQGTSRALGTAGGALLGAGVGAASAGEGHRLEGAAGGAALGGVGGAIAAPWALRKGTQLGEKATQGGWLQGASERALGIREGGGGAATQGLLGGGAALGGATLATGLAGGALAGYGARPQEQVRTASDAHIFSQIPATRGEEPDLVQKLTGDLEGQSELNVNPSEAVDGTMKSANFAYRT